MDLEWTSPVAIGGVGGSGTRLVASLLIEMGYAMGTRLNDSLDDLDFTDTFVDAAVPWLPGREFDERVHRYLCSAGTRLPLPSAGDPLDATLWGWKEPNTHVFLERLVARIPGMRYIHVMRNGLDMAYSSNLNQLRRWGERVLGRSVRESPTDALAYWVRVHRRVLSTGELMGSRFMMLNYDQMCHQPSDGVKQLLGFLGINPSSESLSSLCALVDPPSSLGRHAAHQTDDLDPEDVEFVKSLGFTVR